MLLVFTGIKPTAQKAIKRKFNSKFLLYLFFYFTNTGKKNIKTEFWCSVLIFPSQLTKKVNNVESSWALGAALDFFHHLKMH